jgi:hypothetical protein
MLIQSIVFYIERWAGTYLFFSTRDYARGGVLTGNELDFSLLEAAYGQEGQGKMILEVILVLLAKNLQVPLYFNMQSWHGEADCLTSILECLVAFSNSTAIRNFVIPSGIES